MAFNKIQVVQTNEKWPNLDWFEDFRKEKLLLCQSNPKFLIESVFIKNIKARGEGSMV